MKTKQENNRLTIYLEGRIDTNNAAQTERELLDAAATAPGATVVLDAGELEYISSAGLRALMKLRKTVGTAITVENVSPEVYEIFEVTGFTELLDVRKRLREISVEGCEIVGRGMPYERCKDLRELNFGAIEGCTQELLLPGSHADYGDYAVQFGGESMDQVGERMGRCLTQIMHRPGHESVLAVGHGACVLAFNKLWLDVSEVKVDHITRNCTVYTFEFDAATDTFCCVDVFEPDDSHLVGGGRVD